VVVGGEGGWVGGGWVVGGDERKIEGGGCERGNGLAVG